MFDRNTKLIAAFAASLLLSLSLVSGPTVAQSDTWATKAPMPTARYGMAAGVIGDKLYVAGGCCVFNSPPFPRFNALEVYDSATDTWATKAPIPLAVYGAAAGVIDGKLYVAGGSASQTEGNTVATLQVYDPTNDTWTTRASMPTAVHGAASGVINGKLYAAGGHNGTFTNALQVYDPASDSWTTKTPMPTARAFPGGGVMNGILYVVGGHNDNGVFATLEVYDSATDTWTTKATMPTARSNLPAVEVINGVFYTIGGHNGSNFLSTVEAYDPAMDAWTAKAAMPTARGLPGVGVINGILHAAGGQGDNGVQFNVLEVFTPADTTPPVLSLPGDIAADATSPAGAIVIYTVTATDNSAVTPTVSCFPPSGGTFSIATTTVNCTATDAAGNLSSGSFTVTVNGPGAQTANLISVVQSFNLAQGISNSLVVKLQNAINSIGSGNATSACNQLNAFINEAQAQSGKELTSAQAAYLIASANQIRAAQGCP